MITDRFSNELRPGVLVCYPTGGSYARQGIGILEKVTEKKNYWNEATRLVATIKYLVSERNGCKANNWKATEMKLSFRRLSIQRMDRLIVLPVEYLDVLPLTKQVLTSFDTPKDFMTINIKDMSKDELRKVLMEGGVYETEDEK